jgi:bacillithiol biosynthesis cysteine-adding enzyme BshC
VRLAREVEAQHAAPAVAVFWIDAEDHDWDEIASTVVLDQDFQARMLTLPAPAGANQLPVAELTLSDAVHGFLADLRGVLPPTEFTESTLEAVSRAYRPGAGVAHAFGQLLEHVLGPAGLVVFDSADPAAKRLAAPVFEHELANPGRSSARAAQAGAALEALGYHAQVVPTPGAVSLFSLDSGRHPIRRDAEAFLIDDEPVDAETLRTLATQEPQRFSPNVLLRPIVQDTLFPTVTYVAGPSELAYLGQLKSVYGDFGVPMPIVVPRATATVLDAAAARFLSRYELRLEQLQAQDESELNRLLQSLLPPQVETSLQAAQAAIADRMAGIIAAVPSIDATLQGAARATLGRMEHELRGLQTKIIQAAKKRDETLRRQFVRTRSLVFPAGQPQERSLGFVWFLNRYGPAIVDVLARDLPPDGSVHAVLVP